MALTKSDTLNYRGTLYAVGQNQTPFLNMIGGLNGGRREPSPEFSLTVESSTTSAAQTVQTEDASVAAGTPTTFTKSQTSNTTQIMKRDAAVSFKKAAARVWASGLNNGESVSTPDSLTFQRNMALLQLAKDVDYSFIQGTYAQATNTATAAQTRGIMAGISTNATAAAGAVLTKALVDTMLKGMYNSGALFQNVVIFVPATQKVVLSNIYGYAPTDRNVGGVNIQQIETDFGLIGVSLEPNMASDDIAAVEMSVCTPVFNPVVFDEGNGAMVDLVSGQDLIWVRTAVTSAQYGGFYYTQIGLDYGVETYHGKITGLAT
jgi:hypothetical protein